VIGIIDIHNLTSTMMFEIVLVVIAGFAAENFIAHIEARVSG